jgi:predicted protein tyrosine phosphatase
MLTTDKKLEDLLLGALDGFKFNIKVLSLAEMIDTTLPPNSAVLSINDFLQFGENMDDLLPLRQQENLKSFLPIIFDDITEEDSARIIASGDWPKGRTLTLFSSTAASLIVMWLANLQMNGIDNLFIHCHAGISRSAAIASAVMYFYRDREYIRYWNSVRHYPNTYVFRMFLEEVGVPVSDEWLTNLKEKSKKAIDYITEG